MPVLPVMLAASLAAGPSAPPFDPQVLWDAWPSTRVVQAPAPCLRHLELVDAIRDLQARHPHRLHVEELGRSVQGRSIHLLTLGRGPRRILLWSQMHGDEPSATPALLDLAGFLLASPDPAATALLDAGAFGLFALSSSTDAVYEISAGGDLLAASPFASGLDGVSSIEGMVYIPAPEPSGGWLAGWTLLAALGARGRPRNRDPLA